MSRSLIPNVVHFCFGLRRDFGGIPFSFVHYLAVKSAFEVHRPQRIYMHYAYKPAGVWWRKALPYLSLCKVASPQTVSGNPLAHYAHKADVLRLDILLREGGVYLDLDVISLKPFTPLMRHECVMGWQVTRGLCNAVILAKPGARFLARWRAKYRDFNRWKWDEHSVVVPRVLQNCYPEEIYALDPSAFFFPHFKHPSLLWGRAKADFSKSYCIHLWEHEWWGRYLRDLSPDSICKGRGHFTQLTRRFL